MTDVDWTFSASVTKKDGTSFDVTMVIPAAVVDYDAINATRDFLAEFMGGLETTPVKDWQQG